MGVHGVMEFWNELFTGVGKVIFFLKRRFKKRQPRPSHKIWLARVPDDLKLTILWAQALRMKNLSVQTHTRTSFPVQGRSPGV